MNQYETAAMREQKYGKARKTVGAARGWEPWQKWEDNLVIALVTRSYGLRHTVQSVAQITARTENAILCRIEKRYGPDVRERFTFRQFEHYGTVHGSAPFTFAGLPENLPKEQPMYERSDAKIFYDAVSDISRIKSSQFFDNLRFAYRVTPTEYSAIRRHIEHQHGHVVVSINLLGVDVVPTMPESQTAIKDYEGSG